MASSGKNFIIPGCTFLVQSRRNVMDKQSNRQTPI